MKPARAITIYTVPNGWSVHEGERYSGPLSWDELLGQVASLTLPRQANRQGGLFGMRTPDEWHEHHMELGRRRWMPTSTGLPPASLDALRMFAREHGSRGGEFDELLPIDQQDDERVRCALRLLELSKDPAHA